MRLVELVRTALPGATVDGGDPEIAAVTDDSRQVARGTLFVARQGAKADGAAFVADALARGAVAVACEAPVAALLPAGMPRVVVPGAAEACGLLAQALAGWPGRALRLMGVTGTNGKTTIAWLVRQMLAAARIRSGLIGTVEVDDGANRRPADLTTPGGVELAALMKAMVANGCTAACMETSSHALHQGRTAGLRFQVAVFTNLTGDHLDYHGTMDAYADAKAILFRGLDADATAIVNAHDPASERMTRDCRAPVLRCAVDAGQGGALPAAECLARVEAIGLGSTRLRLRGPWGECVVEVPLVGAHNAMNVLQAVAAAWRMGVPGESLGAAIHSCTAPPGRLEPVTRPEDPFAVLVDYAHTDDALRNVLSALRPVLPAGGRLHVVFGCGGDRDRTKRPRMAAAACSGADRVVVTSDNPRTEDPERIVDEVMRGVPAEAAARVRRCVDRRAAIRLAISEAGPGDVVLIAGKGHEDYQIIGREKRPFDDRVEARAALDDGFMGPEAMAAATGGRWSSMPEAACCGVGTDTRQSLAGALFVALRGDRFDGHQFVEAAFASGAVAALVAADSAVAAASGGNAAARAARPCLVVPCTLRALQDLAAAWRRRFPGRVVAVTGSSGKTTTRRLVAGICERLGAVAASPRSFNNHLGVPLTLLSARGRHRTLVAEIGMSRPGEIEPLSRMAAPHVAIVTMVGRAHLEALGSVEAIAREKASIARGLVPGGTLVFCADPSPLGAAVEQELRARPDVQRVTFGRAEGQLRLARRRVAGEGQLVEAAAPWGAFECHLQLPGEHNAVNALAAAGAAWRLGASPTAIADGLAAVAPADMRLVKQRVGSVLLFNDAYNANPDAVRAALSAFSEVSVDAPRRVTILGDMLELGPASESLHAEIGAAVARGFAGGPPGLAVFVGTASAAGAQAFERACAAPCLHVPALDDAGAAAIVAALRPGDAILLKGSRGSAMERLLSSLPGVAPPEAAALHGA